MKITKIVCLITVAMIVIASLVGCGSKQLILSQSDVTLHVGESVTLTCGIMPSGDVGKLTWKSMNESVATVEDGEITGISVGQANITVSGHGVTAVCSVTVTEQTAYSQLSDRAKKFVDDFIKNVLYTFKDPSSVHFVDIEVYKFDISRLEFIARITAQNGFGGPDTSYYCLYGTPTAGISEYDSYYDAKKAISYRWEYDSALTEEFDPLLINAAIKEKTNYN